MENMIITLYKIYNSFGKNYYTLLHPKKKDPKSNAIYDTIEYYLPDEFEVAEDGSGMPAIYKNSQYYEIKTLNNDIPCLIGTNTERIVLKKVPEDNKEKPTVKELRTKAGITQQQLADATGINIRQIRKIESGEIKMENITAKNFLALAEVLETDPRSLL